MPIHLYSAFAKRLIVDKETNTLSMVDVFEGVEISCGPTEPDQAVKVIRVGELNLVVCFRREDSDPDNLKMQLEVVPPNASAVPSNEEMSCKFGKRQLNSRMFIQLEAIPITQTGLYMFRLRDTESNKVFSETPIHIIISPEPNMESQDS